jgi:hypothetical protein
LERDLTRFTPAKLAGVLGIDRPDIIVGGPPCQGFSTVRQVDAANHGSRVRRDKRRHLFRAFLDHVEYFKPRDDEWDTAWETRHTAEPAPSGNLAACRARGRDGYPNRPVLAPEAVDPVGPPPIIAFRRLTPWRLSREEFLDQLFAFQVKLRQLGLAQVMPDIFSKRKRSAAMAAAPARVWQTGLRFPKIQTRVFGDGCFWPGLWLAAAWRSLRPSR